jgi:ABC-type nitrate/sulfonate/bicarbonate transport system substrate-binding protein
MGSFSRIVLVVLIALAALSTQKDQALAQERIRIAWAGVSPANSPIWVVQERVLLKKHGLSGEVISISASPIALQALLAGEVDVIVTSVTTLALSRLAGADIVMILGMVPTFLDHIISIRASRLSSR